MSEDDRVGENAELKFNSVIYATDFSVYSENAGFWANLLAEQFSASLVIAHAFILSQPAMEVETTTQMASQQRKNLRTLLDRKAAELAPAAGMAIPVLLDGDPRHSISKLADSPSHAPSIVVLGTHGGGRIERSVIGSVAESILRSTMSPSFTVGPRAPLAVASSLPPRRILCATDLTSAATRGLVLALGLAELFRAEVEILNVIPESAVDHPDRLQEIWTNFYTPVEMLTPKGARSLARPRTFVETGRAHEQILQHIQDRAVDLLVLGIHRSSHLGFEMRTSGAFRIIVDAPCPVLTATG